MGYDFSCCELTGDVSLYLSDALYCCHWLEINRNNFGNLLLSASSCVASIDETNAVDPTSIVGHCLDAQGISLLLAAE